MLKHSLLLTSAVCACHITAGATGFRQKDVHFYFDLFANWMESSLGSVDLQNVQVQRFLDNLVKRQLLKKHRLIYSCEDVGLIPLMAGVAQIRAGDPLELFFFQYHILKIYNQYMLQSVLERKLQLPHGLKIELKYILDTDVLVQKQRERITKEIEKLQLRSQETLAMEVLASKMFKQGKDAATIVAAVEKAYPYQLNHQKKMSELYERLHPNLRKAELTAHAQTRVETLWSPLIQQYQAHLKILDGL